MSKLTVGGVMPDFTYCTPYAAGLTLAQTAKAAPKTALVFLRYYGCTLCQYDIQQLAEHHAELTAHGGQLLVVLQSDPAGLAEQLGEEGLPFAIVCDPQQQLYKQFAIPAAADMAELVGGDHTREKIARAKAAGFSHGAYEGEEMQLPAVFVMDSERTLTYAHYGKDISDIPSPEQLAELLA